MTTVAIQRPVPEEVTGTSAGAASEELVFETVPVGKYRKYHRVSARDVTTAFDKLTIAVRSGSDDFPVSEENTIAADVLWWDPDPIVVAEGDKLVVLMEGTTSSDELEAYAIYEQGPLGDM